MKCTKKNYKGCALCDATWGDYWREIEGENTYFCCNICADAFENMIKKVKELTGWPTVETIEISGNYSAGRNCVATYDNEKLKFFFKHRDGIITVFEIRESLQEK